MGFWAAAAVAIAGTAISAATAPGAPNAPDYGQATREGIQADIDTLPLRKMIEQAAHLGGIVLKQGYTSKQVSTSAGVQQAQQNLQLLQAKLAGTPSTIESTGFKGTKTTSPNPAYTDLQSQLTAAQKALNDAQAAAPADGEKITQYYDANGNVVSKNDALLADFTGYGDNALAQANLDFQDHAADQTAGSMLALQQKYGPAYIAERLKELEQSDPTGFKLRQDMGQAVSDQLALGSKLDPAMLAQVQQGQRAAQAARGNILGDAPAASEAMETGNAGYRLWQQRLANASSFLSGTTPVAQFGQISGAQQGASPYAPQNMLQGLGLNANAGAQAAQFANQQYGTQAGLYPTQAANNPWASLFGSVTGGALAYGANSLFGTKTPGSTVPPGYEMMLP